MTENDKYRQYWADVLTAEALRLRKIANKHRRAVWNVSGPLSDASRLLDCEAKRILGDGEDRSPKEK